MEIWKDIKGYEGLFQASDKGNIRSLSRDVVDKKGSVKRYDGVIIKQYQHLSGSLRVNLSKDGIVKQYFVHQLVAAAFFDDYYLDSGMQVRHIREITDNRPISIKVLTDTCEITEGGVKKIRYKGVRYDVWLDRYFPSIRVAGKEIGLGSFESEEKAYAAYKEAEIKYKDMNDQYKAIIKSLRADKKQNRINREKKRMTTRELKKNVQQMKETNAKKRQL